VRKSLEYQACGSMWGKPAGFRSYARSAVSVEYAEEKRTVTRFLK
jgi:hypothetical protein